MTQSGNEMLNIWSLLLKWELYQL